jgi:hypothetical protein
VTTLKVPGFDANSGDSPRQQAIDADDDADADLR